MTEQCSHTNGPSETSMEGSAEVGRSVCGAVLLVTEVDDD